MEPGRKHQSPAADAIAVEHAQAPGCDQLKTIWPASPAAERRGAMMCTPTAVVMQGSTVAAGAVAAVLPAGQGARDTIIRRREREVRPRHGA
jgi:methylaspartate ammonia-lyase